MYSRGIITGVNGRGTATFPGTYLATAAVGGRVDGEQIILIKYVDLEDPRTLEAGDGSPDPPV